MGGGHELPHRAHHHEAIIERAKHPAFGYFHATEEYFDCIIRWHEKRNGVTGLKPEYIGYENGVLGGVISALNCVAPTATRS